MISPAQRYERLAGQLALERDSALSRERVPEPMAIDDAASVAAFDAGAKGHLLPIYRFNATMLSRLLPENGVLLDLGCGSGQLLAHLADARHDIRLVGVDIADTMVTVGQSMLAARSLDQRVELRLGDMAAISSTIDSSTPVDVISTIWSLHHLPSREYAMRFLREVASVRDEFGCGVWIFDLARLRHGETMVAVINVSDDVSDTLRADAIVSERAAWTEDEIRLMLAESGMSGLRGGRDRATGHLQAWWAVPETYTSTAHSAHWRASPLPRRLDLIARRLEHDLPDLPPDVSVQAANLQ